MPSRVLATVRSCMNGLFGSRLRSSRFICHKVSRQFSSTISLRQFRISSSTLTLFRPPRGLSFILPSRMYLANYGSCCRPVHSKSIRDKQVIFSIVLKGSHSPLALLWRILFLGGIPCARLHKLNFSACRMEYVLYRYEMNRKSAAIYRSSGVIASRIFDIFFRNPAMYVVENTFSRNEFNNGAIV